MDNSVFISYRRNVSGYPARAVFQDLHYNGINTFLDIQSIDSGQFESVILNQIAARPYFVLLLAPGSLDRCNEPDDWLRREIEHAIKLDRIIVPLLTSSFDFNAPYAKPYLTGSLAKLPAFNAVNVPLDYFDEAMARLRTRFLKPVELQTTPASAVEQQTVEEKLEEAIAQPRVTTQQLTAQEYFERALARAEDDIDGQIEDYTEAIRLNPNFTDAYYNRSIARKLKGDNEGAKADYKEFVYNTGSGFRPRESSALNNRGVLRHNSGDLDNAIADYNEAIRLDPQYRTAYINRGDAYKDKGDLDRAIADYGEALRLDPQNVSIYVKRADVYSANWNLDGVIADYNEAIALDPDNAEFYNERGWALYLKEEHDAALRDLDEAIRLDDSKWYIFHSRGSVRAAKADAHGAVEDFKRAIELKLDDAEAEQEMRDYIAQHDNI